MSVRYLLSVEQLLFCMSNEQFVFCIWLLTVAFDGMQLINILTLGNPQGIGGFFPVGLNGAIRTPAGYNTSASGVQSCAAAAQTTEVRILSFVYCAHTQANLFNQVVLQDAQPNEGGKARSIRHCLLCICTFTSQCVVRLMPREHISSSCGCQRAQDVCSWNTTCCHMELAYALLEMEPFARNKAARGLLIPAKEHMLNPC